jgi:hypothetical protein
MWVVEEGMYIESAFECECVDEELVEFGDEYVELQFDTVDYEQVFLVLVGCECVAGGQEVSAS